EYKKLLFALKTRGIKLRYITEITKENVHYCKELIKFEYDIRHLDGIKANFSVSETEYVASTTLQEGQPLPQVIYSNVKDIVQQQKYVFDSFWNRAIPIEQRIREIEEGIEREFFEVITNHEKASQIVIDLAESVKKEALFFLPNDKSMVMMDRSGVIDYLIMVSQNSGTTSTIKIVCPISEANLDIVKRISQKAPAIRILNGYNSPYGMYIVDNEKALRVELREPDTEKISEAIGFSVYSNRKSTVDFFKFVYELLWNERALNEELKRSDKMQKDFINIASHEMKTPTQAILGYSYLLKSHPEKREEMIQAIQRNAIRLQKLTSDILDVTRIESQTLNLNKEQFNMTELILSIIEDYTSRIENDSNSNVKLLYNRPKEDVIAEADKARISQVISNLLSNALKFTREGVISITSEKKDSQIVVSIKDTGTGIHPEIMPRLFSKFATKSQSGIGLGLFISKSIVEAHGGKMWASNNDTNEENRGGASFAFNLPLSIQ
ncbi:MAG: HAMP domain-containing histidine kinase, partial [Thermoproteota archaeon]|nr:HAMP domain-containing histidine kinase [Thermoproteota archaeon]